MIFILISALVLVWCVAWACSDSYIPEPAAALGALGVIISGLALIGSLAVLPIYRANAYDMLAQRDALQATYARLRQHPGTYEMATVGKNIAEWNAWLASAQYWHNTQWSWYWPDEVMSAKPIE